MEKYYKMNSQMKKERVNKWLNSQEGYKSRKKVIAVLWGLAAVVVAVFFLIFVYLSKDVGEMSGAAYFLMGLFVGLIFGCVPFFIGQSIYLKGKKEYGQPYVNMVGEFLYTNEYGVQFGYHNVQEKNSESMYVYQIPYEEITAVHFDEQYQMVTIIGAGEMLVYDDMAKKRVNQMKSQRKFYSNSPYSFILYIEEQDEFLKLLNKNKGRAA